MPGTSTSGSTNIALLDSQVIADLCAGKIYVDLSPSVYIGSGAVNVLGANVQITNPLGVVVKAYGNNYEIAPALSGGMAAVINANIPKAGGVFQFGKYRVDVQLFDGANSWIVTKFVTICQPDRNRKTVNFGSLSALMNASCKDGRLSISVDNAPTYNGFVVESQVVDLTLEYPTASALPVLDSTFPAFSVLLFEGEYRLAGTICATYNFGDSVYAKVPYSIKRNKIVRCIIDECCVKDALQALHDSLATNCTDSEREQTSSRILETMGLLKLIDLNAQCGSDPSDYIAKLEALLGCTCTCNCAEGAPVINSSPGKDFSITGCGVAKTTVGLTDIYEINGYLYVLSIAENGGALTVSAPQLTDCAYTQAITFNISTVYAQIKALANNNTEGDAWAAIVNKSLRGIDPICLGIDSSTWNILTFPQKIDLLISRICGLSCDAAVSGLVIAAAGSDVNLSFSVNQNTYSVDAYLDDIFVGSIFTPINKTGLSIAFPGAADGVKHRFTLIPRCSSGAAGLYYSGEFLEIGCPAIAQPSVTSGVVTGVSCPYDLTTLVSPPLGITVEWHSANNTQSNSLIANPTAVSSGIYYAFARNADGCYSIGTQVTLICEAESSCTAPQGLLVSVPLGHGSAIVSFQSAAFAPPGDSYTVKRRLASAPDVDGSYTTLGTPTWNASISRWQIADSTLVNNTLYVYRAISNCGGSPGTTPSIDFTFANITCSVITDTPHDDHIDYSLPTTGSGGIDKYEVEIYDATGTVLIHRNTHTPAFANPITGTFNYLAPGTTYKIFVTAFIGSYSKTSCTSDVVTTTSGGGAAKLLVTNTNNHADLQFIVMWGNNGGTPTTTLYNGLYSDFPGGGLDLPAPANNANVRVQIFNHTPLLDAHANGVAGTIGGGTVNFSGVNGSVSLDLTTS